MSEPNDAFDAYFELVPAGSDVLSADAELDLTLANLGLGLNIPDPLTEDLVPDVPGRSWAFDFETGQFIRHGAAPAETTGIDTLRTWVEKTMRTARFAHNIYSGEYGLPYQPLIGNQFGDLDLAGLADAIEETLLVHDLIDKVTNLRFERPDDDDDYLLASLTILTGVDSFSTQVPLS